VSSALFGKVCLEPCSRKGPVQQAQAHQHGESDNGCCICICTDISASDRQSTMPCTCIWLIWSGRQQFAVSRHWHAGPSSVVEDLLISLLISAEIGHALLEVGDELQTERCSIEW
jgi:hypothetical protein